MTATTSKNEMTVEEVWDQLGVFGAKTLDDMENNYPEKVERLLANGTLLTTLQRLEEQAVPYYQALIQGGYSPRDAMLMTEMNYRLTPPPTDSML